MISIKILMTQKFLKTVGKSIGVLLTIWFSHKSKQIQYIGRKKDGILSRIKNKIKEIKRKNI